MTDCVVQMRQIEINLKNAGMFPQEDLLRFLSLYMYSVQLYVID